MKVIGLIPFKNEEHFLPTYLSNVKPICDEIIAVDDFSNLEKNKNLEGKKIQERVYRDDLFDWMEGKHHLIESFALYHMCFFRRIIINAFCNG